MPVNCIVVGCNSRRGERGLSFFGFPTVRTREGPEVQKLTEKRRLLWKIAINRDFSEEEWDKKVLCSRHFDGGKKTIIPFTFKSSVSFIHSDPSFEQNFPVNKIIVPFKKHCLIVCLVV